MDDHVVHSGTIQEITDAYLILVDPRKGKHQLSFLTLAEVIYDKETEY